MLIKLFDYKGIKARQIIGGCPFVLDTKKNEALVFIQDRQMEVRYSDCEIMNDVLNIYIYSSAETFQEAMKDK